MPYPNYHAARVKSPRGYDDFAMKEIADGILAVLGIKDGKSEIISYRFSKEKFTKEEAKRWLKEHGIEYIEFEPASGGQAEGDQSGGERTAGQRARTPRSTRNALCLGGAVLNETGDSITVPCVLTVEGVQNRALKPWDELVKSARWFEGIPVVRDHPAEGIVTHETPKLGQIRNVRADEAEHRIKADAVLFKEHLTKNELDILAARKPLGGSIGYFCNSITLDEPHVWEPTGDEYDSVEYNLYGDHFAIVANPACPIPVCGVNVNSIEVEDMADTKQNQDQEQAPEVPGEEPVVGVAGEELALRQMVEQIINMITELKGAIEALKASIEAQETADDDDEAAEAESSAEKEKFAAILNRAARLDLETHWQEYQKDPAGWILRNAKLLDLPVVVNTAATGPIGKQFVQHNASDDEAELEKIGLPKLEEILKKVR